MTEPGADDLYAQVAAKIMPAGKSKVLPRILQKMLTPEQARLAALFPAVEEELAANVGRDLESVRKDLRYMYEIGLGTPSSRSGRWNLPRSYMLLVDKVGSHHRNFLPFLGPEYLDLWVALEDEYLKVLKAEKGSVGTPAGERIIPAYLAVKDNPELQPWESMKAILQMADRIALVPCTCRSRNRKRTCQMHTDEVCFLLNRDADYEVDSKAGRYITHDQALKVTEDCEKLGVLHITANSRAVASLLCNCCRDCCVFMRRLDKYPDDRAWFFPSRYLARIDEAACKQCGLCGPRCSFDAITVEKSAEGNGGKPTVDVDKCMGCGNCAVLCPNHAISLACVRPEEHVPKGLWTRPGEVRKGPEYEAYLKL